MLLQSLITQIQRRWNSSALQQFTQRSLDWTSAIEHLNSTGANDEVTRWKSEVRSQLRDPTDEEHLRSLHRIVTTTSLRYDSSLRGSLLNCLIDHNQPSLGRNLFNLTNEEKMLDPTFCGIWLKGLGRFGQLDEAKQVMKLMQRSHIKMTPQAWSGLIDGFDKAGDANTVVHLFQQMEKTVPLNDVNYFIYLRALVRRKDFNEALRILEEMSTKKIMPTMKQFTIIVNEFAKSKRCDDLSKIFHQWKHLITWDTWSLNLVSQTFAQNSRSEDALAIIQHMKTNDLAFDDATHRIEIQSLASLNRLDDALSKVDAMKKHRVPTKPVMLMPLIEAFRKSNRMDDMLNFLNEIPPSGGDSMLYLASINALFSNNRPSAALDLWKSMATKGISCTEHVMGSLLDGCKRHHLFQEAQDIFNNMEKEYRVRINNQHRIIMVHIFGIQNRISDAERLFSEIPISDQNAMICNTMLTIYGLHPGCASKAEHLWRQMRSNGTSDAFSWGIMFNLAATNSDLELLRRWYDEWKITNSLSNPSDQVTVDILIQAFGKCGDIEMAHSIFNQSAKSESTWNALLQAISRQGNAKVMTNHIKSAISNNISIHNPTWVTIFEMYRRNNSPMAALTLFQEMQSSQKFSVQVWGSLLFALAENGQHAQALAQFKAMDAMGISPNQLCWIALLKACKVSVARQTTKEVEEMLRKTAFMNDPMILNNLIDAYAKCGSMADAKRIFEEMPSKDDNTYTAMISGYAKNRQPEDAVHLFQSLHPTPKIVSAYMSVFSHAGWVAEALDLYENMEIRYSMKPNEWHHANIVDALVRANKLNQAESIVLQHPSEITFTTLLGGCRIHRDIPMARRTFQKMDELGFVTVSTCILMSNIFAQEHMFAEVAQIRDLMKHKGHKKTPGRSWIECDGQYFDCLVGEHTPETRSKWEEIIERLVLAGYKPIHNNLLHDFQTPEEELTHLGDHSEKIAICWGMLKTPPRTPLLIGKNLRTCPDCHEASKWISKVYQTEIQIRDASCFHHFVDGVCSCKDYF